MKIKFAVVIGIWSVIGLSAHAAGPSGAFSLRRTSGGGEQNRWTLADYLLQKQRVRLSDHWLSLNRTGNAFEMFLGGGPVSYNYRTTTAGVSATTAQTAQAYRLGFNYAFFGLEAEYERTNHDMSSVSGAVAIRLLGSSNQSTFFTIKYGLRQTTDSSTTPETSWSNQFAEASLQLYLISFMGLHGNYRYYLPDKSSSGVDLSGSKTTAGVFLEMGVVRLYGDYFQEDLKYVSGLGETTTNRSGYEYGARFYF